MIKIDKDLRPIRGIDTAILKRFEEQGIFTASDLQQNTRSPQDREELAKKIRMSIKTLYIWSKQVDLMRVQDIDAIASELLVKSGVRNVTDLAAANTQVLKRLIDVIFSTNNIAYKRAITTECLEAWKKDAAVLQAQMENDPEDAALDILFADSPVEFGQTFKKIEYASLLEGLSKPGDLGSKLTVRKPEKPETTLKFPDVEETKVKEGGFFFGLSELMVEIGRGIAKAQHELDMSSIEVQKYIDSQETLTNYGLSATWYAMPETSFEMKVDYTVVQEESEEGTKTTASRPSPRLRVAPINAKYENYFKRSTGVESKLNFKIVPVPPPTKFNDIVIVPDLLGLSLEEAQQQMKEARLLVGEIISINEKPENGKETQVVSQSLEPGTETVANEVIGIAYMKEE